MAMTVKEREDLIEKAISLPHAEAIKFWKQKSLGLSPDTIAGIGDRLSVKAFAVSGITKMDALETIYKAMEKALTDGESFGDFKRRIKEHVTAQSWSRRRVEGIYRTNIQTAYNSGHWARYRKDGVEVLVYDAVGDSRTRPTHAALDGKAFSINDKFWDEWYPPNGFGCRCTTQGMSAIEAEARGITVENGSQMVNQSVVLPNGQSQLLLPDKGFNFNPGVAMFGRYPTVYKDADLGAVNTSRSIDAPVKGLIPWQTVTPASAVLGPSQMSTSAMRLAIKRTMGGANGFLDASSGLVICDVGSLVGHLKNHDKPKIARRLPWIPMIRPTMEQADEMFIVGRELQYKPAGLIGPPANDGRMRAQQRYLKRWRLPNGKTETLFVVASWSDTHWRPVTWYPVSDKEAEKLRAGGVVKRAGK